MTTIQAQRQTKGFTEGKLNHSMKVNQSGELWDTNVETREEFERRDLANTLGPLGTEPNFNVAIRLEKAVK